ncbi:MAG: fused MFS/spermidine synthase [Magnetococcales bacterium]|nr:fused MFS/spermidine synthase [Magnetococcales bacterium]
MTSTISSQSILFRHEWQGRTLMVVDEKGYRSLYFDNQMIQSRMALEHPLWLVLPYTQHMLAALLFNAHPRHILMIGLGGGSLAKFFLHYFPNCRLEVVDANPEMAAIARQFFFLPHTERLTLHCADGGDFVQAIQAKSPSYDLIILDAFDHDGMAPSLYHDDFFRQLEPHLAEDGVLALNVNRAEGRAYRQVLATIGQRFPGTLLRLPVPPPSHNEILFCCREKALDTAGRLGPPQAAPWADHQPPLDFVDFLERIVPLKQSFWQQWKHRFVRYTGRQQA